MNHTASDVKVYVTSDYKMFNRIKGNRILNNLKIKKMVRDMKHGLNFLADFPIVTSVENGKLSVHDGQHRFEAAKQMKKPVYYIIRKETMTLDNMARVNSLQEKWKPRDFINCYIEKGIKDYGVLNDFVDDYGTPVLVAIKLLYQGVTGGDGGATEELRKIFEHGEFKAKHTKQAKEIMETCKLFAQFESWNSRPFIVAITKVLSSDKCDFDELLDKFNKYPEMLTKHGTAKDYLVNLEQIYNKGKHKREVIY